MKKNCASSWLFTNIIRRCRSTEHKIWRVMLSTAAGNLHLLISRTSQAKQTQFNVVINTNILGNSVCK